tara:strand:+ start:520 stop:1101 length:582 start_codon:yes stop_codon:yes gene_type:complete
VAEEEEMTELKEGKSKFELEILADLIRVRNSTELAITRIIGRPAQIGHIGEYIASKIFDIELESSAVNPGSDGTFRSRPLKGKSVNIKFYGKLENLLDIRTEYLPDYYLVLTGPKATAMTSKGATRPWVIDSVFLFEAGSLVERLNGRGVKLGTATSVIGDEWQKARIYLPNENSPLKLTERQVQMLRLFATQ